MFIYVESKTVHRIPGGGVVRIVGYYLGLAVGMSVRVLNVWNVTATRITTENVLSQQTDIYIYLYLYSYSVIHNDIELRQIPPHIVAKECLSPSMFIIVMMTTTSSINSAFYHMNLLVFGFVMFERHGYVCLLFCTECAFSAHFFLLLPRSHLLCSAQSLLFGKWLSNNTTNRGLSSIVRPQNHSSFLLTHGQVKQFYNLWSCCVQFVFPMSMCHDLHKLYILGM